MSKDGNYSGILNVLSALQQEQEELFDACINYPDSYSRTEIESNFANQGYKIADVVGDGGLVETIEHMIDKEVDCDDIEDISKNENVCIEVYTDLIEEPVSKYNEDCDGEVVRLYKAENDDENEEDVYQPIVKKNGEKGTKKEKVETIDKNKRPKIIFQCNSDVKVLWSIKEWDSMESCVKSCLLECEVVDIWGEHFNELKTFIDGNEKRPSSKSKNKVESFLGCWLGIQNKNFKSRVYSMKDDKRAGCWKVFLEEYNEYLLSIHELWYENLAELEEFIGENKKIPSSTVPKNEYEKVLGKWAYRQKEDYIYRRNGMKSDWRYDIWTNFIVKYDKYFVSIDNVWNANFDKLKDFIEENKRTPSAQSKNEDEKFLGSWLGKQNKNYKNITCGMKGNCRYDVWTNFLEKYNEYFVSNDDAWNTNFENLKGFMCINKRKPSSSVPKNEYEKVLGKWLETHNYFYKNRTHGMVNDERHKVWTNFLEEYNEYFVSIDDVWNTNFDRLKDFIGKNKKMPSTHSKNEDESFLGSWRGSQNRNYKNRTLSMKSDCRYDVWTNFLEQYNEYCVSNDEIWNANFDKLKEFIDTNKKTPSPVSKNTDEKILGSWLNKQNIYYRNWTYGMKNDCQYDVWTKFIEEYSEYFVSNEDMWNTNFDKLKAFIEENKKTPTTISRDKDEKVLGRWLSTQNKCYKDKTFGMKNDERYDVWFKFLEQYNEYFDLWNTNFENLKNFIEKNNKIPTPHSKDKDEKFLGSWLGTQNQNYKNRKYRMINDEQYDIGRNSFINLSQIFNLNL
jgi:hypothetical protein